MAGFKEQCLVMGPIIMGRYKREVEPAGGAAKYAGDAAATMLWKLLGGKPHLNCEHIILKKIGIYFSRIGHFGI